MSCASIRGLAFSFCALFRGSRAAAGRPLGFEDVAGQPSSAECFDTLEVRLMLSATPVPPLAPVYAPQVAALLVPTGNAQPALKAQAAAIAPELTATAISPTKVRLAWGRVSAKELRLQVREGSASAFRRLVVLPRSRQGYVASGLKADKSYHFRVVAIRNDDKLYSNIATVNATAQREGDDGASAPLSYGSPITITLGGTYSGNWQSLDANVPAVRIRTNDPVIIENSNIRARGALIDAYGYAVNLTVRSTNGFGLNPNVRGRQAGRFLDIDGFVNLRVQNNYMEGTTGIYVYNYRGNQTAQETVVVERNIAHNIDGRLSDGNNGYLSQEADHYVQFFQINGVHNLRGATVAWNQVVNLPGQSLVEDNISIFDTSGSPDDPFRIANNYIHGAYPLDPATNTDGYSGGGIMVSDVGSSYIVAHDNQVIDTTNYGIAISSGHHNAFYSNRIISPGVLANGSPIIDQNVGAYIWNMNGEAGWNNNIGFDNVVGWVRGADRSDWWVPDATGWTQNESIVGVVTLAMVSAEWQAWLSKLSGTGISLGVVAQ